MTGTINKNTQIKCWKQKKSKEKLNIRVVDDTRFDVLFCFLFRYQLLNKDKNTNNYVVKSASLRICPVFANNFF